MKYLKTFQQLTNASPSTPPSGTPPPPAGNGNNNNTVQVFTTAQSIVTFPIASLAVMIIWKVLGRIFPEWGESSITLLFIALSIGILIYIIGLNKNMTVKEKIIAFVVAIINSFFLMASALGILQSINT